MELGEDSIQLLKSQSNEFDTNLLFKIDKIEKLPHLPFLKRKLKATIADCNEKLQVTIDQHPVEGLKMNDYIVVKKIKVENFQEDKKFIVQNYQRHKIEDQRIMDINQLQHGMKENWRIKARVIEKSQIIQFKTNQKKGSYFTISIIDRNEDFIECRFYSKICDQYFDQIQIGQIYLFENGVINKSAKNKSQQNQIVFNSSTKIKQQNETDTIKKFSKFSMIKMNEVSQLPNQTFINVICQIKIVQNKTESMDQYNRLIKKRNITIKDETDSMSLILWNEFSDQELSVDQIIIFKNLKVVEFNNFKSLSTTGQTVIIEDCKQYPGYQTLNEFFENANYKDLTNNQDIIHNLNNLKENQQFNSKVVSQISKIEFKQLYYMACPKCRKKIEINETCKVCDVQEKIPILILDLYLIDQYDTLRVKAFDKVAEKILNYNAQQIYDLTQNNEIQKIQQILNEILFEERQFTINSKHNQQYKSSSMIIDVQPINMKLDIQQSLEYLNVK